APTPQGLDRVLEQLAGFEPICALRCLEADEEPQSLPADVRALTLAGREQHFEQRTLAQARQAVLSARQQLERRQAERGTGEQLETLAAQAEQLAGQEGKLREERAGLPALLETEAASAAGAGTRTTFQARLVERASAQAECLAELDARRAARQAEADKIKAE